jgi:hypothetical protein
MGKIRGTDSSESNRVFYRKSVEKNIKYEVVQRRIGTETPLCYSVLLRAGGETHLTAV